MGKSLPKSNDPVFRAAYLFAVEGGDRRCCPHPEGTIQNVMWLQGFQEGSVFRTAILDMPEQERAKFPITVKH